jgi:hypothetical protein
MMQGNREDWGSVPGRSLKPDSISQRLLKDKAKTKSGKYFTDIVIPSFSSPLPYHSPNTHRFPNFIVTGKLFACFSEVKLETGNTVCSNRGTDSD